MRLKRPEDSGAELWAIFAVGKAQGLRNMTVSQ
jgi:hypothetical protein